MAACAVSSRASQATAGILMQGLTCEKTPPQYLRIPLDVWLLHVPKGSVIRAYQYHFLFPDSTEFRILVLICWQSVQQTARDLFTLSKRRRRASGCPLLEPSIDKLLEGCMHQQVVAKILSEALQVAQVNALEERMIWHSRRVKEHGHRIRPAQQWI